MARNRQRAKERQAERRAARQAATPESGAVPNAQQRIEAPPEELGRSDFTLAHTNEDEEFIGDLELERQAADAGADAEVDDDGSGAAAAGPRGVRGGRDHSHEEEHHEHTRVVAFLIAVWAELNRVQWPNRNQLTSLTSITLMFVLIVGGYLGLLDAVFSRLVSAIL